MKKFAGFIVSVLLLVSAGTVSALDKLTTVAIVDVDKVYLAYYEQSTAVRDYNKARQTVQDEYKVLGTALVKLQEQKLSAQAKADSTEVLRIEQEMVEKAKYIRDYKMVKDKELAVMRESLTKSDVFKQELDQAIEYYAISQGFTIVLTAGADSNVYWWSTEVDITSKVIETLKRSLK